VTNDANDLNEQGRALAREGRVSEAEAVYREAMARAPDWSVPAYNLGLLLKYQRRWSESLAANRRATDLAPEDEAAWWISYADELLRASRDDPDSMPPCGGPLLPGFAAEYAARVRALHDYHARDVAARHSPYFDDLARIDAAGFLDEYVWENLQKSGAAMPPGLDLAAFLEFRALELPRHAYFTGARVRVNRVRVLPPAD